MEMCEMLKEFQDSWEWAVENAKKLQDDFKTCPESRKVIEAVWILQELGDHKDTWESFIEVVKAYKKKYKVNG